MQKARALGATGPIWYEVYPPCHTLRDNLDARKVRHSAPKEPIKNGPTVRGRAVFRARDRLCSSVTLGGPVAQGPTLADPAHAKAPAASQWLRPGLEWTRSTIDNIDLANGIRKCTYTNSAPLRTLSGRGPRYLRCLLQRGNASTPLHSASGELTPGLLGAASGLLPELAHQRHSPRIARASCPTTNRPGA